ncbi:hypothetical protein O4H50_08580 [Vibrio diazotrophicus]|uniref:hypothetical protein n=1 Tax=Vibrio TaxID=662 RepID=UPI001F32A5B0|nr:MULTISPECIES: hypothetical protein [Vibrio]MCF7362642.1 hypothetical protein [Vibrio sp. A1-b2]MCZ4371844.1 hypothetical protein [Vibrio diazotrophicus]
MAKGFRYYLFMVVGVISCMIGVVLAGSMDVFRDTGGTWLGAIGTVSTLVFLTYQHSLDRRAKINDEITKLSQEALNAYINAVDSLIEYLSNEALGKDRKFAFLKPTYLNLVALEKKITVQNHRDQAQAKFEELHVHLTIFYSDLKIGDILTVESLEAYDTLLLFRGNSWASCVTTLVRAWLEDVVPMFGTIKELNSTSYGWRQKMIDDTYMYYLLTFLLSSDIKLVDRDSVVDCIVKIGNSNNSCRIEINDRWFLRAVDEYPGVLAHLLLRSSGFRAIQGENAHKYEPRFSVYGPEGIWFCIDYLGRKAYLVLKTPDYLNNDKYTTRIEKSDKVPNAGSVRVAY